MSNRLNAIAIKGDSQSRPDITSARPGLLQRKCACDNHAISAECQECSTKRQFGLLTKLRISESGDVYEQEADRIADRVLATPSQSVVSGAPICVQRFAEQSNGQMEESLGSFGIGRPLEPVLRQDMEQRFGHDFSQVRVHTDANAAASARSVNALAYTVGHDIVFGAEQFAPATHWGRRLLAHELAHTIQQGSKPLVAAGGPMKSQSEDLGERKAGQLARHRCNGREWPLPR